VNADAVIVVPPFISHKTDGDINSETWYKMVLKK